MISRKFRHLGALTGFAPIRTLRKRTKPISLGQVGHRSSRIRRIMGCCPSARDDRPSQQAPLLKAAFWRTPPVQGPTRERVLRVDIVEKLEFLRRSHFRGPPEASTEYSLGVRLSDRSCHVRRSNRRCCGNYRCRQHYMRSSEIFAAPQFPSFSTVSVDLTYSARPWAMTAVCALGSCAASASPGSNLFRSIK